MHRVLPLILRQWSSYSKLGFIVIVNAVFAVHLAITINEYGLK